jgi:hypothetical protein
VNADWNGVRRDYGQFGEGCIELGHAFGCPCAAGGDVVLDDAGEAS